MMKHDSGVKNADKSGGKAVSGSEVCNVICLFATIVLAGGIV